MSNDKRQLLKARGFAAAAATGTVALQNILRILKGDGFGVLFLVFLRYAGAVAISSVLVIRHVPTPAGARHKLLSRFRLKDRAQSKRLSIRGYLMFGVSLGVVVGALLLNNTQFTTMSLGTVSVFVQLIGYRFFDMVIDRPVYLVISIILSAIGVGFTAASDWTDIVAISTGFAVVVFTSVCNATNQLLGKRANEFGDNRYLVMFYQSIVGFIASLSAIVLSLVNAWTLLTRGNLPWHTLAPLVLGVCVLGFLPALWLHRSTEQVSPGRVSAVAIIQMPIGFMIDWLGFDILPNTFGWIAISLLVGGAYCSIRANQPVDKQKP
ncbi:DMT family transporter [Rhizobacter sp. Root1221]|uniref:DMT family transporter n=1 Tax=Rhizobacter sp. Root1221 TaxID=1736433 RepID=UPI0006FD85C3|nr:DMT family transporter [Rhizobacter sp. Root1221]KQV92785.1 hypothetical protein ASC87_27840 [Rhizobacter sp. Root1221]